MTQTYLFDIDQVDPVEVVSEAHRIARQNAYDDWQAAFLRRFYARREAAKEAANRVVHCKREKFDVYIGRPSKWGNPFQIGRDGTRDEVIAKYRAWVVHQPELMAALPELRGKVLGCWCSPEKCHGDILAELAEQA